MTRPSDGDTVSPQPLVPVGEEQSGGRDCRLSLFRVSTSGPTVPLRAPSLIYYGVVEGETVITAGERAARSLAAGESIVVPPLQTIRATFPAAGRTPVRWVALKINRNTVDALLDRLGPVRPPAAKRSEPVEDLSFCAVPAEEGVRRTLQQIGGLFREDPPHRDALLDLSAHQLMIRLLETPAYPLLVEGRSRHSVEGGIAAAVQYIHDHLDRHISIDELVEEACMSKSSFYRHFRERFGMSPLEYITRERVVQAQTLLSDAENTVADVSHALGFSSTSYFIDMFKEHQGQTPKQYQMEVGDAPPAE